MVLTDTDILLKHVSKHVENTDISHYKTEMEELDGVVVKTH